MNTKGWIPEGSTFQVNPNQTLSITPPTGWVYVGTLENSGEISLVANGATTVSCTCNTTGSCLPFVGSGPKGSTSGCVGTCTNCTMKQSVTFTGDIFSSGGYLNLSIEPTFILLGEEFPAAFKEMNNVPEVNQKIQQFYNEYFQGQAVPSLINQGDYLVAPSGFLIAMVNICGRAMPLVVPEAAMVAGGAGGAAASCSCTNGTCTIQEYNVPLVGGVKYCEGSCSGTCTLKTSVMVGGAVTYVSETFNF
jgi:hypothetical protein